MKKEKERYIEGQKKNKKRRTGTSIRGRSGIKSEREKEEQEEAK